MNCVQRMKYPNMFDTFATIIIIEIKTLDQIVGDKFQIHIRSLGCGLSKGGSYNPIYHLNSKTHYCKDQ